MNTMKKFYIVPEVEINETLVCQMMALSMLEKEADDSAVEAPEMDLNIWD